jgi:hypothetical protein
MSRDKTIELEVIVVPLLTVERFPSTMLLGFIVRAIAGSKTLAYFKLRLRGSFRDGLYTSYHGGRGQPRNAVIVL